MSEAVSTNLKKCLELIEKLENENVELKKENRVLKEKIGEIKGGRQGREEEKNIEKNPTSTITSSKSFKHSTVVRNKH